MLLTGVSYADPGGLKYNRDQLAATDSFSRLSESALGEYSVIVPALRKHKEGCRAYNILIILEFQTSGVPKQFIKSLLIDFCRKENGILEQASFLFLCLKIRVGNWIICLYTSTSCSHKASGTASLFP